MRAVAPTNVGLPGIAIFRPGQQIKGRRWAPRDSWTNGKDQANRTTAVALAPIALGFKRGRTGYSGYYHSARQPAVARRNPGTDRRA